MKIHHIGYLVKSTDAYLKKCFGDVTIEKQVYDPVQKSKLTLVKLNSDIFIELIEPNNEIDSDLKRELSIIGEGFHHVCYICTKESEYLKYVKNAHLLAGPFNSIMFNCEIEFYTQKYNLIEEIVKSF